MNFQIVWAALRAAQIELQDKGKDGLELIAHPHCYPLALILHAGRQEVANYKFYSFNEYRIELDKDLGDNYLVSLAYGDTSANPLAYADTKGINGGRGKLIAFIKKSF